MVQTLTSYGASSIKQPANWICFNARVRTVAAALLGLCSLSVQAEPVYKYEDRGLIIYQDRAPDSVQDNGHSILNHQGVTLEQVLSRQDRREARKMERKKELSRIRDRALLATFTAEEDLIRTRDDRVGMIDGLISRLDDRIRILSERLAIVKNEFRFRKRPMARVRLRMACMLSSEVSSAI